MADIDIATFRALQQSAGEAFVAELVATYVEEAPKMIAAMGEALKARNEEAFRRAAHSLKSNSLTFGAVSLAAMARELELGARPIVAGEKAADLDALASEQARVAVALEELGRG